MKWHGGKGSTRRPGSGYNTGWDLIWNKVCQHYFTGTTYPLKCYKSKCQFWDKYKCRWDK